MLYDFQKHILSKSKESIVVQVADIRPVRSPISKISADTFGVLLLTGLSLTG